MLLTLSILAISISILVILIFTLVKVDRNCKDNYTVINSLKLVPKETSANCGLSLLGSDNITYDIFCTSNNSNPFCQVSKKSTLILTNNNTLQGIKVPVQSSRLFSSGLSLNYDSNPSDSCVFFSPSGGSTTYKNILNDVNNGISYYLYINY